MTYQEAGLSEVVVKQAGQEIVPRIQIDATQLRCPMPLLKAKQALNRISEGEIVEILATDGASKKDITAFIQMTAHDLLVSDERNGVYRFQIKKHDA